MATFNKFYSFVEAICEGVHDFENDTLELALSSVVPVNTNTQLTNLTQIAYTYLSARTLAGVTSGQTTGLYTLDATDKVISCTGGTAATFRYVTLFNQDATNDELIGWWDYGAASVTLADGEDFTVEFDVAGILTVQ